jgi:MYXO-CTERM domain-containing protein
LVVTQGGGVIPDVSGAIGPYALGGCPSELDCHLSGYFPFELGIPFTIDLSGVANGFPPNGAAAFLASASLQLFELPTQAGDPAGAPVQIYVVPEPGSAGLAFTGLSALMLFAVRQRRNSPSI